MTVKEYTAQLGISKRLLADIKFGGGDLLVNGEHVTVRTVLAEGDVLKIEFPKEHVSETLLPEPVPLDILYEDDHVLVVNKQPYVSSIPSREHPSESIANGVISHYRKSGVQSTVHLVTRLDRDTSGRCSSPNIGFPILFCRQHRKRGLSAGDISLSYTGSCCRRKERWTRPSEENTTVLLSGW